MPLMAMPTVVFEMTLRSVMVVPPNTLFGELATLIPMPTGVVGSLLRLMVLPAIVSPPVEESACTAKVTLSISKPRIVTSGPFTSRPMPVVALSAVPSSFNPPLTVEASITVPVAVMAGSGVAGLIVWSPVPGKLKVIATPVLRVLTVWIVYVGCVAPAIGTLYAYHW
jgi:hypothetical protein